MVSFVFSCVVCRFRVRIPRSVEIRSRRMNARVHVTTNGTKRDRREAAAPHLGVDELIESVVHHQDARADANDRGGELAAPVGVLRDDAKAGGALRFSDARNRANSIGTARERLAFGETSPEAEGGGPDERGGHFLQGKTCDEGRRSRRRVRFACGVRRRVRRVVNRKRQVPAHQGRAFFRAFLKRFFSFHDYRRCPRPSPCLLSARRSDRRCSRIAAAIGFPGRLCATPTSRATSFPSRKKRNDGTVSIRIRSRTASSSVSMSTLTKATSGKAADMSTYFG